MKASPRRLFTKRRLTTSGRQVALLCTPLALLALGADARVGELGARLAALLPATRLVLTDGAREALLNGAAFAFVMALVLLVSVFERARISLAPAAPAAARPAGRG